MVILLFSATMKDLTNDPDLINAAEIQDEIGYDNFLFGRLARNWKFLQRDYLQDKYPHRNYSADAWIKRLLRKWYSILHSIWDRRCKIVHGHDRKKISKRTKKALKKEIKLQFRLGPDGVRAEHREFFQRSLSTIYGYSIKNQQYWARTLKASRILYAEDEKNMFTGMRSIMKNWARIPI